MGKRHVISQLEKHFSRLKGERESLKTQLAQLGPTASGAGHIEQQITSLGETLDAITLSVRLFEPAWNPAEVVSVKPLPRTSGLAHAELLHIALDVMREEPTALSTREIIKKLWLNGSISEAQFRDPSLKSALTSRLRKLSSQGSIRLISLNGERAFRWAILPSPNWSS